MSDRARFFDLGSPRSAYRTQEEQRGTPFLLPLGIFRYDTDKVECSCARGAIQDAIEFPVAPSRTIQNPPLWVPTIGIGVPAFRVENEECPLRARAATRGDPSLKRT